ncbi:hypothetical protein NCCP1664_24600 [Zafaria cholistanensis]|uniref:Uncharacterized protein n=1 Tax=Zafaria cholistanensis TaxID=1682741 RepID=A0A5A7NSY2_9MICC|nr:hypothetical protein [Zafaria cholistanensis]GER23965.1 hypothetical protein NCCP1664_24600 [Zafaria cholistanensis]
MKIGLALEELHRAENDLAQELLQVSERHKADHEIYHLGRDLAGWSHRHIRQIAEIGRNYGLDLDPEPESESAWAERIREKGAELLGRRSHAALLLLRDLREIYMKAAGVSADWDLLGQAAQGIKHTDLLDVAQRCHPDTLRQMHWAHAKLKEEATQILIS